MITATIYICATLLSAAAIAYLLLTDPKRARVFKQKSIVSLPRKPRLAWVIVFSPAAVLLVAGQTSAFLAWFGTMTVVGWLMAMKRPGAGA
ncbi:MAG: hypothetical protein AAGI89_05505 [Pseudomonadota bacterium]